MKEPTPESLTRKKKEYMPPHFMTAAQGAKQLMAIIAKKARPDVVKLDVNEDTLAVGAARIGSTDQKIVCCKLHEMANTDLGPPLHSLVIVGDIHPLEQEYLSQVTNL